MKNLIGIIGNDDFQRNFGKRRFINHAISLQITKICFNFNRIFLSCSFFNMGQLCVERQYTAHKSITVPYGKTASREKRC